MVIWWSDMFAVLTNWQNNKRSITPHDQTFWTFQFDFFYFEIFSFCSITTASKDEVVHHVGPPSKPGMKQEGSAFSYWELVYSGTSKSFGWMPLFERAPRGKQPPGLVERWQSNHSSRAWSFAASKNKLHELDCHGNWAGLAFEVEGGEWKKKRERVTFSV